MKTILKLHPHKHTGKLLHHRHTSYRALFLLLALAGAVLLTPVGMARADNYLVTAVVPAPLPSDPAVITSPHDSSIVNQPNIIVSGNCPVIDPPIIVVLYDGSTIVGSQYCSGGGSFAIPVSLSPGSHSLVPQVVNFTGQNGAAGTPILITSNAVTQTETTTTSIAETSPSSDSKQTTTAGALPELITDSGYVLFSMDKDAVWNIVLRGGTAPYGLTVDWGDGTIQHKHNLPAGQITVRHHYNQFKIYQLRAEMRDAKGHVLGVSIVALSPAAYNPAANPTVTGSTTLSRNWLLYTLYILTVVALTMFWHRERMHYAHQPVPIPATRRRRTPTKTRKR